MNKLGFLTKYSLGKKIKSKWFIVVNIIILLVISALINMDSIIKLFGGDFNNNEEILVIDNIGVLETFKEFVSNQVNSITNSTKFISYSFNISIITEIFFCRNILFFISLEFGKPFKYQAI